MFKTLLVGIALSLTGSALAYAQTPQDQPEAEYSVKELTDRLRSIVFPPPVARNAKVAPPPDSVTLRSISFAVGSSDLSANSKATLNNLAEAMRNEDIVEAKFTIEGHTDAVGTDGNNMKLSERRAAAVASYLTAKGVATARVTSKGYGETRLIEKTEASSAVNRRVEVVLQGTESRSN